MSQEGDLHVQINLDYLIGSVRERLDTIESFNRTFKNYSWYANRDHDDYRWAERGAYYGRAYIHDVSMLLDFDVGRLYSIARAARKWEEQRDWQLCFPANEHAEKILRYLRG